MFSLRCKRGAITDCEGRVAAEVAFGAVAAAAAADSDETLAAFRLFLASFFETDLTLGRSLIAVFGSTSDGATMVDVVTCGAVVVVVVPLVIRQPPPVAFAVAAVGPTVNEIPHQSPSELKIGGQFSPFGVDVFSSPKFGCIRLGTKFLLSPSWGNCGV